MKMSLLLTAALAVIATPALAQEPGHHPAAAAPAGDHGHHHADFQSGRFHVRVDGTEGAPDIILIPGLSSSPEVWDALTAELSGRYRIHRIHVQGFAGAPAEDNATGPVAAPVAEDIARYIAEKGLDRPAVIGHSMGGTIAMMLAARHPDSVGRLMVVDMVPFVGAMFGAQTVEAAAPVAAAVYAQQTRGPEEAYRAAATAGVTGMIATEDRRAGPLEDAATSDRMVSAASFRELVETDLRPELGRITVPVMVLYVTQRAAGLDAAATDAVYQASFSSLPSAKLKRIDDSAHFIMLDQPARFAAEVNAFLE